MKLAISLWVFLIYWNFLKLLLKNLKRDKQTLSYKMSQYNSIEWSLTMCTWDESDLLHRIDDFAAFSIKAAVCQCKLQIKPSQADNLFVFKVCLLELCAFVDKSAAIILMAVSQMGFNLGCLCFLITHQFLLLWFGRHVQSRRSLWGVQL